MITKTIHCFKCGVKLENLQMNFDDFMQPSNEDGKVESIELLRRLGWNYVCGNTYCAICKKKVNEMRG